MKATTWIRTPGTSHKRQGGRSVGRDSGGLRRCQDLVCKSKLVDKSEAGGCDGGGGQVGQGREAEAGVKGGERREEKRGEVIPHSIRDLCKDASLGRRWPPPLPPPDGRQLPCRSFFSSSHLIGHRIARRVPSWWWGVSRRGKIGPSCPDSASSPYTEDFRH